MKNITVSVPTETWRIARLWCAENDTTLSEMVSGILWFLPKYKPGRVAQCKQVHRRELAREHNADLPPLAFTPGQRNQPLVASGGQNLKTACETVKAPLSASTINTPPPQEPHCDEL